MSVTTSTLLMWALLLVAQNASFTWVSRARSSGSDIYHGIAAVFSNGIWFAANFITLTNVLAVVKSGSIAQGIGIGLVYIAATVSGSVAMGRFLRTYVERGKRRIGHYEAPKSDEPTLEARVATLEEIILAVTDRAIANVQQTNPANPPQRVLVFPEVMGRAYGQPDDQVGIL